MKVKKIEITFNDNTDQDAIDRVASTLATMLEACDIVATILVQEVETDEQA